MVDKITLVELQERLNANPELVLVEALPEQYFRHSHIPGAININHDEVDERAPELLPHKDAEIVGLNFDRNIHGLVRNFVYDETRARNVAVDSRGIVEAMRSIYGADELVKELTGK